MKRVAIVLYRCNLKTLKTAAVLLGLLLIITGLAYPFLMTGLARVLFPAESQGSLVERDGKVVGSKLIGQSFDGSNAYFQGRPSAAGSGYDAAASGGSNLGPTNDELIEQVKERVGEIRKENGLRPDSKVPADLVTASASGLDPQISPQSAYLQVNRVASARGVDKEKVRAIVTANIEEKELGVLGEPRVNVLLLNLDLDRRLGTPGGDH